MTIRSFLIGAATAALACGAASAPALAWHHQASNESASERAETAQLNREQLMNSGYENGEYANEQAPMNTGYSANDVYSAPPTNNGGNGIHSANGEPPAYGQTTPRGTPTTYGP